MTETPPATFPLETGVLDTGALEPGPARPDMIDSPAATDSADLEATSPLDAAFVVRPLTAKPASAEEIKALDRLLNAAVEGAGTRALWSAVLALLAEEQLEKLREYVAHKERREYALGARAALRAVRPLVTERDQQLAQAARKLRQVEHERQRLQAEVERLKARAAQEGNQQVGQRQNPPRKQGTQGSRPQRQRRGVSYQAPAPQAGGQAEAVLERPTWDYPEQPTVRQRASVTETSESVLVTARAIEAYLQLRGEVAQAEVVSAHEAYTESGAAIRHLRLSGKISVQDGMISVTGRGRGTDAQPGDEG